MDLSSKTLVVYRNSDADSYNVASIYANSWDIDNSMVVGIDCSDIEILPNYASFYSEVESPVLSAIQSLEVIGKEIFVIILGYNVPGGFVDGGDIISSTSRISRIKYSFEKFCPSYLYDRQQYQDYDSSDAFSALITSRIDASSFQEAISIVEASEFARRQSGASGSIYVDQGWRTNDDNYQEKISELITNILPYAGLDILQTQEMEDYSTDSYFGNYSLDSFVWTAFQTENDGSIFTDNNLARIFFYNVDSYSAYSIRDILENYWCRTSLAGNYAACAGAMSDPSFNNNNLPQSNGHLNPISFFNALLRGAKIGEAFLFACEFYDSPICLFGDPLLSIDFNGNFEYKDDLNELNLDWINCLDETAKLIAYNINIGNNSEKILDEITASNDVTTKLDLLKPANDLYTAFDSPAGIFNETISMLVSLVNNLNRPPLTLEGNNFSNITNALSEYDMYTTELFNDYNYNTDKPSDDVTLSEGEWIFSFIVPDTNTSGSNTSGDFGLYHFRLTISENKDYSLPIIQKDSALDQTNWQYETMWKSYNNLSVFGLSTAYIGGNARYKSQVGEGLTRGKLYYVRLGIWDSYNNFQEIDYDYEMIQKS